MNDKETPKEAPKRSPNFPSINLEDSLANATTLYNADKLAATSADVLVGHLGYNKLHGTSRRVLSSMKNYGLIDELSDNRFKISEFAYRLIHSDLNSPKAIELLKEAAMKPAIFRNIIMEYKGNLPSDRTLTSYLVLEKGFTPDGALQFAKVLRDNVEFASITDEDFAENKSENVISGGAGMITEQPQQQQIQTANTPQVSSISASQAASLPNADIKETILNFKISRKSEARIIFFGEEVTQEAIELLKMILETQKAVYPTKAELEAEKNEPKQATWRNKDYDQAVAVTGELGEVDGKRYFSIEGSKTGVSEDELDFGE